MMNHSRDRTNMAPDNGTPGAGNITQPEIDKVQSYLHYAGEFKDIVRYDLIFEALTFKMQETPNPMFNLSRGNTSGKDLLPACEIKHDGDVYLISKSLNEIRKMDLKSLNTAIDDEWGVRSADWIIVSDKFNWIVALHHSGAVVQYKN